VGQQWYEKTIAGNVVLSYTSQAALRHRFSDWPGAEDQIGSSQRHSEDLISLSRRYIEELEKFVQKGMEEGILSG
jgi:predicted lactoylglutathione lyase